MEKPEVPKWEVNDLPGLSQTFSGGKSSDSEEFISILHSLSENQRVFSEKDNCNVADVTKSLFPVHQNTGIRNISPFTYDIFHKPLTRDSVSEKNSHLFESSCNSNKLPTSSKFACFKCGFGFPCSPLICRRNESSLLNESDYQSTTKLSSIKNDINSVLNDPVLLNNANTETSINHSRNSFSKFKSSETNSTENLFSKQKNIFIFKEVKAPKKSEIQCQSNSTEENPHPHLSSSKQKEQKYEYNSVHASAGKKSFSKSLNTSLITSAKNQTTKIPIGSLSEGTKNFLNELASSNACNYFNASESGYALSSINSPFSSRKKSDSVSHLEFKNMSETKDSDTCLSVSDCDYAAASNSKVSGSNTPDIDAINNMRVSDADHVIVSNIAGIILPNTGNEMLSVCDDEIVLNHETVAVSMNGDEILSNDEVITVSINNGVTLSDHEVVALSIHEDEIVSNCEDVSVSINDDEIVSNREAVTVSMSEDGILPDDEAVNVSIPDNVSNCEVVVVSNTDDNILSGHEIFNVSINDAENVSNHEDVSLSIDHNEIVSNCETVTVSISDGDILSEHEAVNISINDEEIVSNCEAVTVSNSNDNILSGYETFNVSINTDESASNHEDVSMSINEDEIVSNCEDASVSINDDESASNHEDVSMSINEDEIVSNCEAVTVSNSNDNILSGYETFNVSINTDESASNHEDVSVSINEEEIVSNCEDASVSINDDEIVSNCEAVTVSNSNDNILSGYETFNVSINTDESASNHEDVSVSINEEEIVSNCEDASVSINDDEIVSNCEAVTVSNSNDNILSGYETFNVSITTDGSASNHEDVSVSINEEEIVSNCEDASVSINDDEIVSNCEAVTVSNSNDNILSGYETFNVSITTDGSASNHEDVSVSINDDEIVSNREEVSVSINDDQIVSNHETVTVSISDGDILSGCEVVNVSIIDNGIASNCEDASVSINDDEIVSNHETDTVSISDGDILSGCEVVNVSINDNEIASNREDVIASNCDDSTLSGHETFNISNHETVTLLINDNNILSDHETTIVLNSNDESSNYMSMSNQDVALSSNMSTSISEDVSLTNNMSLSNSEDMSLNNTISNSEDTCTSITKPELVSNSKPRLSNEHDLVSAEKNMSMLNDIDSATESKDVTNALDLIEQSSVQDKNSSSAEICSSLNQIFSDANMALSASAVSNVEYSQTKESDVDYETITLQTVDSNNLLADSESGTINLADLCSGNNSELWQQILLVQDESGNIETVLLLSDDAQVKDLNGVSLSDVSFVSPPENNMENLHTDQGICTNSIPSENISDLSQDALAQETQGDVENDTQDIVAEQNCINVENSAPLTNVLVSQNNLESESKESVLQNENSLEMNYDLSNEEKLPETIQNSSMDCSSHSKADPLIEEKTLHSHSINSIVTLIQSKSDLDKDSSHLSDNSSDQILLVNNATESVNNVSNQNVENFELTPSRSENNQNEDQIIPTKRPLDESESITNPLKLFSNDVSTDDNKIADRLNLNLNSDKILIDSNNPPDVSNSNSVTAQPLSKAKKRCLANKENSVSIHQHNQSKLDNATASNTSKKSCVIPVNGAVYHFKSNSLTQSDNLNSGETEISLTKSIQKSKKTLVNKLPFRSAKKTFLSQKNSEKLSHLSTLNSSQISHLLKYMSQEDENYETLRNLFLKRELEKEITVEAVYKRPRNNEHVFSSAALLNLNGSKIRTVALKTFKKPFTAAKKSFDSRDTLKNLNTALKTCVPKVNRMNKAVKSFRNKQVTESLNPIISKDDLMRAPNEKNVPAVNVENLQRTIKTKKFFQPEVCEIKILPNDYVKRASNVLLKSNTNEPFMTPDENLSEEETKLSSECISPMKELMLYKNQCSCSEKEVPCLCVDNSLQVNCEATDTFDEKVVPCRNPVSQQYLLTPSSEIGHRAFCDIHIWRLRHHHCCPKCGIFCTQGEFLLCSSEDTEHKENHLFHKNCFIVPSRGLPPSCPHCCRFSSFISVNLSYVSTDQEQKKVPSDAVNITSEINGCDVILTYKQDSHIKKAVNSAVYIPAKNEIEMMISSLAKEDSLRLRPTGKCLYNPIRTGDVQKVLHLIGNGVNPNHKFRMHQNNAPLHVAAYYGWTGILHVLLQAGAFIDSVNDDLETPLIVAVEKNQLPIVRYLILAGAQIDVKDCNGMTSFHIASKNGFKEIAEFLYSTGRIDINLQDDGGWTALVWACEHKHVEFVRWLLEIGADPNVRDNEENTVLHWAAYSGKSEIAMLLLDKGCTLSYVNKRGDSALHIAAREDNHDCVKLFIENGAVLDQKNKENKTPLMCCQNDSLSFNYLCQSMSSGSLRIGRLQLEKHVVFRDISRGAEAYPIQAFNDVDDEEFIMEFRYVVKQCHRSGVNIISTVNTMKFCDCKDGCVKRRDCKCTKNARCWYNENGCLTSEYDLQTSPIIFECNKTCHCPKTCINRVVQHGMKFPLQIFRTQFKGWGVRTLTDIPKGSFVCEYVGEVITGTEASNRADDTYLFDLESQGSDYCLDGRYFGNVARFLNHSCEPNLVASKVFVEHQDLNFPRIAFFAIKEIQAFDELCFDYGLDFWIVKCQTILCTCNSPLCKYSKDSIDDTLLKFFMNTANGAQLVSGS